MKQVSSTTLIALQQRLERQCTENQQTLDHLYRAMHALEEERAAWAPQQTPDWLDPTVYITPELVERVVVNIKRAYYDPSSACWPYDLNEDLLAQGMLFAYVLRAIAEQRAVDPLECARQAVRSLNYPFNEKCVDISTGTNEDGYGVYEFKDLLR